MISENGAALRAGVRRAGAHGSDFSLVPQLHVPNRRQSGRPMPFAWARPHRASQIAQQRLMASAFGDRSRAGYGRPNFSVFMRGSSSVLL